MQHPNIATVFDYGEDEGTAYLVMELVAGQPLSQVIAERAPGSGQETSSVLIQAAMAPEDAHQGPPPQLPGTVPVGVREVISACLAKAPADRPPSAAAMAHTLGMPDAAFASGVTAVPAAFAAMPTQAAPTKAMPIPAAPTQAMPTPAGPTQAIPAPAMPTGRPGIPVRRPRWQPAWLLGAAALAVLGILAGFALAGTAGTGRTPAATASTPSTSATTSYAPPAITSSGPSRLNNYKGHVTGHVHKKDGKQ